jgi:hypothetical protein
MHAYLVGAAYNLIRIARLARLPDELMDFKHVRSGCAE